jgi:hypothetical protein
MTKFSSYRLDKRKAQLGVDTMSARNEERVVVRILRFHSHSVLMQLGGAEPRRVRRAIPKAMGGAQAEEAHFGQHAALAFELHANSGQGREAGRR